MRFPALRRAVLALALTAAVASTAQRQYEVPDSEDPSVQAQQRRQITQPGNNAPVWRDVRSGQEHFTEIRGREAGVLIQSMGETWRQIRNGPVTFYGGWLVVLVLVAIVAFYFTFGAVKLHDRPSGRLMHRFSTVQPRLFDDLPECVAAAEGWARRGR